MHSLDFIERDRAGPVDPVAGRGRLVIEGILRLTANGADEGERGLMLAARRISEVDPRGQGMVGNHAAEKIGRDAADEPRGCAETRHADSDVEPGTARPGHAGVTPGPRV